MTIRQSISEALECMTMTQKAVVAIVITIVLVLVCFGGSMWSGYSIRKLEKEVSAAKTDATRWQDFANKKEIESAQYKQKVEHLEGRLVEIKEIARTQDEELEKLNFTVRGARADVERARSIRSITSTADELCERLKETEHPCYE